jgi:HK97 family phage major capsid protein
MSTEIKNAVEALAKSVEDFRTVDRDYKSRADAEIREAREKASAAIDAAEAAKKAAEDAVKKASRASVGGTAGDSDADKVEHKKAWGAWARKGIETGLAEIERKAINVTTGADGGFALPEQIESRIAQRLVDISPIRSIANVVTVSTSDYKVLVDVRGTASGWVGEAAARTETNTPTLNERAAFMGEIYANPMATQQSLDDLMFNVEAWIAESIATEFAFREGQAFVSGNGTSRPKGFLDYATATTADSSRAWGTLQHVATGVSADFAASNKGDKLYELVYALKAGHRANARWVMNKALLGEIRTFKESTTNAYLWQPGLAAGQPSVLAGYPIVESEDMPAKGANSLSIAFGDFRAGYTVVDRVGVRSLRDPYTNKPYVGFYTTKRVGGMVVNSEAIKVLRFGTT